MSTRDPDLRTPEELSQATLDVAARIDAEIAAARPVPDFSAMLERARELAPDLVSEADVARAGALAPVIPLGAGERHGGRDDAAALAPFTAALRAELDAAIAERRMSAIPPPPLPTARRRLGLVVGLALAAAAALLFVLVRPTALDRAGGDHVVEARADADPRTDGEAHRGGAPERHVRAVVPAPDEPVPEAIRDLEPVPEDSTPAAPEPVPEDTSTADTDGPGARARKDRRDPAPARPRARPTTPAGPSLEDEAQALWERGELAAAERKYREIVDLAGGVRAELAYGDLFALVRQLRGPDGPVAVWREYLRRFPAGRFADDARAGLCLRAADDARAACWRDYLERHPRGAHRTQAEAALATEDRR